MGSDFRRALDNIVEFPRQKVSYTQPELVVEGKLRPPLLLDVPPRPRLIATLNEGLAQGQRVTVIMAPLGYGKTTIAVQWAEQLKQAVAWLSLDAEDSDPARFLRYLAAALERACPGLDFSHVSVAGPTMTLPPYTVAEYVIRELRHLEEDVVVVIDEWHLAENPYLKAVVEHLVAYMPATCHIALLTREEPALPMGTWRLQGIVNEVTSKELALTSEETMAYVPASHTDLASLTGGWPAAVSMYRTAARKQGIGSGDLSSVIKPQLTDYLLRQVWASLDEDTRAFLLGTAVLRNLDVNVCEKLTGQSGERLEQLARSGFFVEAWESGLYRYNPLFREFLLGRLSRGERLHRHSQAAKILWSRGELDEALHHAHLAEEMNLYLKILEQFGIGLVQRGELVTLKGLLKVVPRKDLLTAPGAAVLSAWVHFLTGEIVDALGLMEEISRGGVLDVATSGAYKALQVIAMSSNPQTLDLAREAVKETEAAHPLYRVGALLSLGRALTIAGLTTEAADAFHQAHLAAHSLGDVFSAVTSLGNLVINLTYAGRLNEAARLCEWAEQAYAGSPLLNIVAMVHGMVHFFQGNLTTALQQLGESTGFCKRNNLVHMIWPGEWYFGQGLTAQGQHALVDSLLDEGRQLASGVGKEPLYVLYETLTADVALQRNDIKRAARWYESLPKSEIDYRDAFAIEQHIVRARIMAARHQYREALTLLAKLRNESTRYGRYLQVAVLSIVEASVMMRASQPEGGLAMLKEAMAYCLAEGLREPITRESPYLLPVLRKLESQYPETIGAMLGELGVERAGSAPSILSERELELMGYVIDGLSNQEIADKLFITVGTAKWHLNNIYSKLGVERRAQAIAKVKELRLLPNHRT